MVKIYEFTTVIIAKPTPHAVAPYRSQALGLRGSPRPAPNSGGDPLIGGLVTGVDSVVKNTGVNGRYDSRLRRLDCFLAVKQSGPTGVG